MDGQNQYLCAGCMAKSDATRCIALKRLPDVMTLQLLRFVYDMKTYTKKKLTHQITFPHAIDMSRFVNEPQGRSWYDLQAVVMHRGQGASSGHYIAQARSYAVCCCPYQ